MDGIARAARIAGSILLGSSSLVVLSALPAAKSSPSGVLVFAAIFAGLAVFAWPRGKSWRHEAPSQRQLRYAADLGIRVRRGATKGEVSDAISQATGR